MKPRKTGYGQYSLYSRLIDILYVAKDELDALPGRPALSSNDVILKEAARDIRERLVMVCYKAAQQNLTTKQHRIFTLRHKEDLTYDEVGAQVNQPYGTVYNVVNGIWNVPAKGEAPRVGGYMKKLTRRLRVRPDVKMLLHQWKDCIVRHDAKAALEYLRKKDKWWDSWKLMDDDAFVGDIYEKK